MGYPAPLVCGREPGGGCRERRAVPVEKEEVGPSARKASAMARPMPWAAPVTAMWRPSRRAVISPLRHAAVGVPPERVAPAVAGFGGLDHLCLVHLDAEAGAGRDRHHAVRIGEDGRIDEIVEQVAPGAVVVDAERLLLNEGVVADRIDLKTGGESNRAERTVRASATS